MKNYIYNFNEYSLIKHRKLSKRKESVMIVMVNGLALFIFMIIHLISDAKLMAIKFKRTIN